MTHAAPSIPAAAADSRRTVRRAVAVWGIFAVASAVSVALLQISSAGAPRGGERLVQRAGTPGTLGTSGAPGAPGTRGAPGAVGPLGMRVPAPGALRTTSITPRFADIDRSRWRAIVIHHSGTPGGDAASLERKHVQDGLTGLGYHFIIGNGQGLDDGQVSVGYRWDRQLAGAHVAQGPAGAVAPGTAAYYNEHAVAICLVGNGERRAFTERQMHELVSLVRQLQAELGIPASEVRLHSSISGVASPGQFFPVNELMTQILP